MCLLFEVISIQYHSDSLYNNFMKYHIIPQLVLPKKYLSIPSLVQLARFQKKYIV